MQPCTDVDLGMLEGFSFEVVGGSQMYLPAREGLVRLKARWNGTLGVKRFHYVELILNIK